MLVQPMTNQIITKRIQNSHGLRTEKKERPAEQTMTALPSFADAKSFVNISFKARIHDCAKAGDWDGVKRELENGVDVNLRDEDGWTALKNAAINNRYSIVKNLLQYPDIDVNAKSNQGWTALMNAACKGYTDIVKELLKHPDIDVNIANDDGDTALIQASYKDNPEAVRELLKHPDIDVNIKDNDGNTALILASLHNTKDVAKELLKHPDVDVNIKDNNGMTASDYANTEIREMIRNYVRSTDKREEVLTGQIDIKKLTSFDEIWTDDEKQYLENLIETKDFKALAKFFESKGMELNEKYRYLITDIDKLKEQIRISEIESGIRTLYGIKPDNLPENMTLGEQMIYVTDILSSRKSKLTGTDIKTPERITKALQDDDQKISNSGLKFLGKIIDIIDGTCEENDIINAIESVKGNYGTLNMAAVAFFISTLAWNGKNIHAVTEYVRKNAAKACKI